jgi:hypothetical protein
MENGFIACEQWASTPDDLKSKGYYCSLPAVSRAQVMGRDGNLYWMNLCQACLDEKYRAGRVRECKVIVAPLQRDGHGI